MRWLLTLVLLFYLMVSAPVNAAAPPAAVNLTLSDVAPADSTLVAVDVDDPNQPSQVRKQLEQIDPLYHTFFAERHDLQCRQVLVFVMSTARGDLISEVALYRAETAAHRAYGSIASTKLMPPYIGIDVPLVGAERLGAGVPPKGAHSTYGTNLSVVFRRASYLVAIVLISPDPINKNVIKYLARLARIIDTRIQQAQ